MEAPAANAFTAERPMGPFPSPGVLSCRPVRGSCCMALVFTYVKIGAMRRKSPDGNSVKS
jgi:hypothetical protein